MVSLQFPSRLLIAAALLAAVVVLGVGGYMSIEHWQWFDALYMTVTTLTTVGGGEPQPLSYAGRWLTLGIIVFGVGVTTYTFFVLGAYLLEGQLGRLFDQQRVLRKVRALTDHFVLCGYGRVGREIAREFLAERVPFVVVDINPASIEEAARDGYITIAGNATDEAVLRAAGIERARGLVTAVDSDASNVYVTLSARVLRPSLSIIARANEADSHAKLRLAGANRIISPYQIGGKRMASLALRPTAVEFIDTVLEAGNSDLLLEDITIPPNSSWIGKTLGNFTMSAEQMIVLAIKRDNTMLFRPTPDTSLRPGDEIIAAGPSEAIRALEQQLTEL